MKSNSTQKTKPCKAKFWKEKIEEWSRSKLTQMEFCANHNLTLSAFVYWKGKLDRLKKGNMLLPVTLVPDAQGSHASGLSVTVKERFVVNLGTQFCPDTLCQLVKLLDR